MHHEQNFAYQRDRQRGDAAVAAVRLAHAVARSRAASRWSAASRSGSSARSRRGTRRACSGCASSRRRSRSATRSCSSPTRRRPVVGGAMFAAVFKEAGLPDGLLQIVIGGAEVGEALVTDPNVVGRVVHRLDGGRAAGRHARRRPAQEGLARARRQQRVHRPRRRRPRRRDIGRRLRRVPVPGPGLLRGRPPHRPSQQSPTSTSPLLDREGEAAAPRRSVPRGRRARPDRQREADRAGRRDRPALGRGGAPSSTRAAPTRACSTGRRCSTDVTPEHAGLAPTRSSGPVAPVIDVRHRRRGASRSPTRASTASSPPSTRARSRAASRWPTGSGPAWSTSTTGRSTTRRSSRSAGWAMSGNGGRFGGEANLDTFTEWQWVTVRDEPPLVPVLTGVDHRRRSPGSRASRRRRRRGSSRPRTTRSARRRASACSTRRGRSTTCRTRWPAGCSRAGSPWSR